MSFLIYLREAITNSGGSTGDRRSWRRSARRRNSGGDPEKTGRENQGRPSYKESASGGSKNQKADGGNSAGLLRSERFDRGEKFRVSDRPKWIPPQIPAEPLPVPDCPYCGKPIHDIASALNDRGTGRAVHFDCIIARINQEEILEKGDCISYIGGGRFGIVHFSNPGEPKKFTIKKILEWENKEDRPQWRSSITDHFSVT
ncbi:MAG: hypothetical protein FWF22_00110 [Treponema sp.]|nr:hypothetical protein [Treponema sp.]